jgi:hypothetical protein
MASSTTLSDSDASSNNGATSFERFRTVRSRCTCTRKSVPSASINYEANLPLYCGTNQTDCYLLRAIASASSHSFTLFIRAPCISPQKSKRCSLPEFRRAGTGQRSIKRIVSASCYLGIAPCLQEFTKCRLGIICWRRRNHWRFTNIKTSTIRRRRGRKRFPSRKRLSGFAGSWTRRSGSEFAPMFPSRRISAVVSIPALCSG